MPRTGLSAGDLKQVALHAAEKIIRRHGIQKTRLVDIAKEINVSHPVLYRLFPNKEALIDAVSEYWLTRIDEELAKIVSQKRNAKVRLQSWFLVLHRLKREKVAQDPELYQAFNVAAEKKRPIIVHHVTTLKHQLTFLMESGIRAGEFAKRDPTAMAQLLFDGMIMFHHPKLVLDNLKTNQETHLKEILSALIKGIV